MVTAAASNWFDDLPDDEPTFQLESPGRILPVYAPGVSPRDYGLRWYQVEGKAAVESSLEVNRSCLVVMATGLGKTRLGGAIAGDWPGNVLWLAHRDELIQQARDDLERITGEMVEVEQGQQRASSRARIVVGSVDTVKRQNRLDRYGEDRFSLVIVDEAHHYTAATYRRPLDFFKGAKLLGLTATPDRGDEKALGQIFDDVAFVFDIQNGIEQGYLVPIRAHTVEMKEIDISGVKTQAGDLVAAQLDEVMLKACAGIVSETIRYEPTRRGIGFMPGVKSAELAAQLCNKAKPGSASFVSGATPQDERRDLVRAFKEGRTQYLWNCMIATEGFDAPNCSLIIQGRPTKSRALYAQMAGRGTRVPAGLVESMDGQERAGERRAAIAASPKPDMVLLDFVGNAGKHSLISAADILGGNYSEAEVTLAKKRTKAGGDVLEALETARAELRRIAEKAAIMASSIRREVDPFGVFHIKRDEGEPRFGRQPMTQGQYDYLKRMGLGEVSLAQISKADASKLIATAKIRRDHNLCTFKQMRLLQQNGVTDTTVSFGNATLALNYIFQTRREGNKPAPEELDRIIHRQREPGEE